MNDATTGVLDNLFLKGLWLEHMMLKILFLVAMRVYI